VEAIVEQPLFRPDQGRRVKASGSRLWGKAKKQLGGAEERQLILFRLQTRAAGATAMEMPTKTADPHLGELDLVEAIVEQPLFRLDQGRRVKASGSR
jgi:stalled ribosome alternative rescue factor ArfA